jgi:hypothetical protein
MKIIGIKGDGEIHSIEDAIYLYGQEVIQGIISDDGQTYLDEEGNPLWPVFSTNPGEEVTA